METYDIQLDNGWTSMQNCNTRQIYELLMSNTNCKVNQHFKQKWAEILKIDLDWQKIWKTFHENKAENKIKSDIFCQLHLNFFTPFMAFKNQVQASAICNLCKRSQLEQHHELVSCIVTKRLFSHFETFLTAISPEILEEKETVIGLGTDSKAQKHRKNLRNLFTFTIRSIIHRNKWTNFSGMNMEQISNQLTENIKSEFKTQMTNRYAICRENNEVDNFIKHCLLDGTIGKLAHDKIEWSALLEDM